jgi:hypothetical protein
MAIWQMGEVTMEKHALGGIGITKPHPGQDGACTQFQLTMLVLSL